MTLPSRWLGLALAPALLLAAAAAPAQDEPEVDDEMAATEAAPPALDIEAILGGEDDVFAGRGYGYDPADRRDPFRSLVRTRESDVDRGPRPEGIPGLMIGELDLTGVFVLPEGPVAQVQTSDRDRSYLLRVGDKLLDGDVVGVSLEEIVFRQILDDPTALTPFREVVKRLNP
ncbi:MAG: hypothetical protein OES32_08700 [Acidobacteriota bacterium]|nr:hypothetical protein [Acidobacteriota bacterium]MDH3523651.1 hypothetical protein [Acidobacteriota bacterium]